MENLVNNVQTEFQGVSEAQIPNKKTNNLNPIVLNKRDYEVILFLLEMKFSPLEEIHFRFFKNSLIENKENGISYAKKRIYQLEKNGFVSSTKAFDATKRLYFATQKSYSLLSQLFSNQNISKFLTKIDGRTVVHDYYVLKMRTALESNFGDIFWISDKHLKQFPGLYSSFDNGNTPDGIYNSWIALGKWLHRII